MADFKTHLQVSSAVGFASALAFQFLGIINNFYMSVIVFIAATFGGFLPDIDSNSSLPTKVIFTLYGYLAAGLAVYFLNQNQVNPFLAILVAIAVFFGVYQLKILFTKFTTHRGIFHSIPAMILSFLLSLAIVQILKINILEKFAIALAVFLGYFSHLILDEIYSVNLFSEPLKKQKNKSFKELFKTKKSYGTALDLGFNGKEKYPAYIAYGLILILTIMEYPIFKEIITALKSS